MTASDHAGHEKTLASGGPSTHEAAYIALLKLSAFDRLGWFPFKPEFSQSTVRVSVKKLVEASGFRSLSFLFIPCRLYPPR